MEHNIYEGNIRRIIDITSTPPYAELSLPVQLQIANLGRQVQTGALVKNSPQLKSDEFEAVLHSLALRSLVTQRSFLLASLVAYSLLPRQLALPPSLCPMGAKNSTFDSGIERKMQNEFRTLNRFIFRRDAG